MQTKALFFTIFFILIFISSAVGDSLFDRAGQDLWYSWKDANGKSNGHSHEILIKTTHEGAPALKTISTLLHVAEQGSKDFALSLVSTELEPMVRFSVKVSETIKDQTMMTAMKAWPEGVVYIFIIDRAGKKERVKVDRSTFDYFDFEDHYLYAATVIGASRDYRILNSFTLGVEKRKITLIGEEKLKVDGKTYDCRKFTNKSKEYLTTLWRDKKTGAVIRQSFPNKAIIEISTEEKAKKL